MEATSKQVVFSWGANSYGQLGLGHNEDKASPALVCSKQLPEETITVVTGGGGHTLVLTANGSVYSCGWNVKGQLGQGHTNNVASLVKVTQLENVRVIAAGWDFSLAATVNGQLFCWGSNRYGQLGHLATTDHVTIATQVNIGEPIIDVAAGLRHSVVLAESGDLYGCGSASKGQLGSNENSKIVSFKKFNTQSVSSKIVTVAAGAFHTAFLTESGVVYILGSNKHGQLGPGGSGLTLSCNVVEVPLASFGGKPVRCLSSGWDFIVASTASDCGYSWGRGDYGQLGRPLPAGDVLFDRNPALIVCDALKKIACGSEHCIAISGSSNSFSWGWNEHGMCGCGDQVNVRSPRPVKSLKDYRTILIGCGAGHSLAVCESPLCR